MLRLLLHDPAGQRLVLLAAVAVGCSGVVTVWVGLLLGLLALVTHQFALQFVRWPGEPPLFGGPFPFLGLAIEFGSDHAAMLHRLASACGEAPAFTAYIAGQRMTFVKSPLDFPAVTKERERLQFDPVGFAVMRGAFAAPAELDMNGEAYRAWAATTPHQV